MNQPMPEKMDRRVLLARVRIAMENGFSATRLGYLASGDPLFVKKLKDGHRFKVTTLWRAYDMIEEFDSRRHPWVAQGRRKTKTVRATKQKTEA
jgi:uncharacterized protein (UPF0297 family)